MFIYCRCSLPSFHQHSNVDVCVMVACAPASRLVCNDAGDHKGRSTHHDYLIPSHMWLWLLAIPYTSKKKLCAPSNMPSNHGVSRRGSLIHHVDSATPLAPMFAAPYAALLQLLVCPQL